MIIKRNGTLRVIAGLMVLNASGLCSLATGGEWTLSKEAKVRTSTQAEGRTALSQVDLFIKAMSPFDLAVRLKTNEPSSREAYLRQTAAQVEEFTEEEQRHLAAAMEILLPKLAKWKLPWPREVFLVKTTAEHESGAAYCRGPVIVLPASRITPDAEQLARLLAHELFHVLSNQNPKLRQELYHLVGFSRGGQLMLPKAWDERRLTNPDAPMLSDYALLKIRDREAAMVPLLYAEPAQYDPQLKKGLFGYMQFKLLEVRLTAGGLRPIYDEQDQLILHPVSDVPDYFEKIGRNTKYIIHPEEVLAENFVLLLFQKQDVPTPELLEKMAGVLKMREE